MSDNKKNRVILACWMVGALLMALVIIVALGEPRTVDGENGGDWFRNLVFDFQTLLTGILAVGAAAVTVIMMERTDKEAERRHRELVSLTLRTDRLRVERMLHSVLNRLKNASAALEAVNFPSLRDMVLTEPETVVRILEKMNSEAGMITLVLRDRRITSSEDLFDGKVAEEFARIPGVIKDLTHFSDTCISACTGVKNAIALNYPDFEAEHLQKFRQNLICAEQERGFALGAFRDFVGSLERMKAEYESVHWPLTSLKPSPDRL